MISFTGFSLVHNITRVIYTFSFKVPKFKFRLVVCVIRFNKNHLNLKKKEADLHLVCSRLFELRLVIFRDVLYVQLSVN